MPLCQLLLTSAGTLSAPLQIRTNLYGKYKLQILGLWSNVAVSTAVQVVSRQLLLPFAGSQISGTTSVGALANQSTRYPTFLISSSAVQYNQGFAPLIIYSDLDGTFDVTLIDTITQAPLVMASNTIVILNLDLEPVDTSLQQTVHQANGNLGHTFTQLPVPTYGKVNYA
jgi:hypothetical protein